MTIFVTSGKGDSMESMTVAHYQPGTGTLAALLIELIEEMDEEMEFLVTTVGATPNVGLIEDWHDRLVNYYMDNVYDGAPDAMGDNRRMPVYRRKR